MRILYKFNPKKNKMKAIKLKSMTKNIFIGIFVSLMMVFFTSCATKMVFLDSPVVPGAKGNVSIKNDKNKNYTIQIEISYLAEIEKLQPPKNTYVVWLVTKQESAKNIGRITSSKKLKASFKTVSSVKPTKIFITAENDGNIQYPGTMVVLSTSKN